MCYRILLRSKYELLVQNRFILITERYRRRLASRFARRNSAYEKADSLNTTNLYDHAEMTSYSDKAIHDRNAGIFYETYHPRVSHLVPSLGNATSLNSGNKPLLTSWMVKD